VEQIEKMQKENLESLTKFITRLLNHITNTVSGLSGPDPAPADSGLDESKHLGVTYTIPDRWSNDSAMDSRNAGSAASMLPPLVLFKICSIIWSSVQQQIPDYDPVWAVGAFFFLRTICPAILSPVSADNNYVLQDVDPKSLTANSRRNLVLAAKVVQNISANVQREKEKYMNVLSDMTEQYHPKLRDFVTKISTQNDARSASLVGRKDEAKTAKACAALDKYVTL